MQTALETLTLDRILQKSKKVYRVISQNNLHSPNNLKAGAF